LIKKLKKAAAGEGLTQMGFKIGRHNGHSLTGV